MKPRSRSFDELAKPTSTASPNDDEDVFFVCGSVLVQSSYHALSSTEKADKADEEKKVIPCDPNAPYTPFKINDILVNFFLEDNLTIAGSEPSIVAQNPYPVFNVLNRESKNIAVFNVLIDKESSVLSDRVVPTLDRALEHYIKTRVVLDHKIVIPLSEVDQRHFRLLVIEPDETSGAVISYYESRNRLMRNASILYGKVTQSFQQIPSFNSFFQAPNPGGDIEKICRKHLKVASFTEIFLGHQDFRNTTDCGPYVVEYLRLLVRGEKLSPQTKIAEPSIIRGWQRELSSRAAENSIEAHFVPTM
jgi:hypothetical protein